MKSLSERLRKQDWRGKLLRKFIPLLSVIGLVVILFLLAPYLFMVAVVAQRNL